MKVIASMRTTLFIICGVVASARADTVVVTADRMLDVLTGKTVDHPQITVTDGRIAAVGAQGSPLPAGARRVDLQGMTLLPCLIDMHVHLTSDPHYSGYRRLQFTDNFWTVTGVANAKKTLEAGFTTVRNVGSANYDDVALKQAIELSVVPGPRVVPATYAIGATGGHCDTTELPPSISVPKPAVANGPEEIRATVRKLRKYGAEVIKFCGTGGVLSKTDTVGGQQYSLVEMKALVDEAHMLGLGWPFMPMAPRASKTPSARASTPSNTRASPTKRRSPWPNSMAPGSRWTSTTTTTFSPKVKRTVSIRSRWRRNA